jgi:hypothetical protein
MFKIGERVMFRDRPWDVFITTSVDDDRYTMNVVPSDYCSDTRYTDVSQSLFVSERIYLRRKKINRINEKLRTGGNETLS